MKDDDDDKETKEMVETLAPLMNLLLPHMLINAGLISEEQVLQVHLWHKLILRYKLPTMKGWEESSLYDMLEKLRGAGYPQFDLTMAAPDSARADEFFYGTAISAIAYYGSYPVIAQPANSNYVTFFVSAPKDVTQYDMYKLTVGAKRTFRRTKLTTLLKRYIKQLEEMDEDEDKKIWL